MINYKHVPMYVRYFWQPWMGDKSTGCALPEKSEVEKINIRISCLNQVQRKELFKLISENYEVKIIKKKTFLSIVRNAKEK